MKTSNWAPIVGATIAAAALAATAVGSTSDGTQDGARATPPPADSAAMVSQSPSDQAATYAVLKREKRASDDPGTGPKGPFGSNLELARKVQTSAGTVRVVPANEAICLRADTKTGSAWACTSTADAKAGRLILSMRRPGSQVTEAVFALIPDEVRSVAADVGDAKPRISVTDNIAALESTTADALVITDVDGAQRSILIP